MRTNRIATAVLGTVVLLALPGGCSGASTCVPGASQPCACTSGASGAQVCRADGTFGACTCDAADAGSMDAAMSDAASDAGTVDDSGAVDSGAGDSGAGDSGASDSGADDSGAIDASRADGGVVPRYVDISAGADFACVVRREGTVACWGQNAWGQLGVGTLGGSYSAPRDVVGVTDAVAIASGDYSTCVVRRGGGMQCWGVNSGGMFGFTSSPGHEATPVEVPGAVDARAVAVGESHACFIDGAGVGRCMGLNTEGQLGDGTRTDSASPVRISGLRDIRQLTLPGGGTCARLDSRTYCWGGNGFGTLGTGDFASVYRPMTTVLGLTDAIDVAASRAFGRWVCAVRATGRVECWGNNQYGMLLDGMVLDRPTPEEIPGITDAIQVRQGLGHGCVIRRGGGVSCWGGNWAGQLGEGTTDRALVPVSVALGRPVMELALGTTFSCALDGEGVWCWGDDEVGQLGDGATSTVRSLVPTPVSL